MRIIRNSLFVGAMLGVASIAVPAAGANAAIPGYISAAVANPDRPQADRERDALRKPAEVIAFSGMKPGDRVAELVPARGYFTHIFCRVVGTSGHVYTVDIKPAMSMSMRRPPPAAAGQCANVTASSETGATFKLPGSLDVVWTSENYHDFHNKSYGIPDIEAFDKVIFDALKPGGVFIVEDHVAPAGSGASDTGTLHRIDPALVKKEVEAAGFRLVASSDVLHNPDDPHTERVFALNGHSDKFLLKFEKPR